VEKVCAGAAARNHSRSLSAGGSKPSGGTRSPQLGRSDTSWHEPIKAPRKKLNRPPLTSNKQNPYTDDPVQQYNRYGVLDEMDGEETIGDNSRQGIT
jgi:hypothetical protein